MQLAKFPFRFFLAANRYSTVFHRILRPKYSAARCGSSMPYLDRLKAAGINVVLTEYPDAFHAYDGTAFSTPIELPQAQTTRNCTLREGDNGQILNAKTGVLYKLSDPCVEHSPHVGFNQAAYEATVKAVREFLTMTFKLSS